MPAAEKTRNTRASLKKKRKEMKLPLLDSAVICHAVTKN